MHIYKNPSLLIILLKGFVDRNQPNILLLSVLVDQKRFFLGKKKIVIGTRLIGKRWIYWKRFRAVVSGDFCLFKIDCNDVLADKSTCNVHESSAPNTAINVAANTAPDNAVNVAETTPTSAANSTIAVIIDKSNYRWNFLEDDALIDVLVEEVRDGGKHVDNGWNPGTLMRVAKKLRTILGCPSLDKGNVNNRLRTLKEKYVLAKEACALSGFSMTPDGRIMGDDITWEAYIQATPKARSLCYFGIRHFDKLCIIFGADHAHGNLSYEPNDDLPLRNLHLDFGTTGDTSDAPEFMNVDPDIPTGPAYNDNPPAGGGGTFGDGGQPSGGKGKGPNRTEAMQISSRL